MSPDLEVTVLLPCLNEAETLEVCVRKALGSLAALGVEGEVLVSDNGSTDGSQEIAVRSGARVVHAPRRGYGAALIHGIAEARGRYVIMADADDSYDLTNLGPFVNALREGHDVVMGNRFRTATWATRCSPGSAGRCSTSRVSATSTAASAASTATGSARWTCACRAWSSRRSWSCARR
jgi:glycosyltransferase involved in cell wall biosynthesis